MPNTTSDSSRPNRWSTIRRSLPVLMVASVAVASMANATPRAGHGKDHRGHHQGDRKGHAVLHKGMPPKPTQFAAPSPAASSSPKPSPTASSSPPVAPSTGQLKPVLSGLLTRGFQQQKLPYLGGFVVRADWKDLEPRPGVFNFSEIDRQVGSATANGYGVKFRIYAGDVAPDWAKGIGGPPMPFYDHMRKMKSTLGRFWDPGYQMAWQGVQTALADRYDSNPTVREVNVSGTCVESAEVSLLIANDKIPGTKTTNGKQYASHGYTEAARQAALWNDINFMAAAWPHTRINLFVHPMQTLNSNGSVGHPKLMTEALITKVYNAHPDQIVFGNTGLGVNVIKGDKAPLLGVYNYILSHNYPFDIQTQTIGNGMGNPAVVLGWAASRGLLSLELPSGWKDWNKALLASTSAAMQASARKRR